MDLFSEKLSFGAINIPLAVIPLLVSWFLYSMVTQRIYQNKKDTLAGVNKIIFNGIFITLVLWKISPLFFQFSTVMKNPSALFYLPGGISGLLIGLLAASIYVVIFILKGKKQDSGLIKNILINISLLLAFFILTSLVIVGLNKDKNQENSKPIERGTAAPAFFLETPEGQEFRLSDYTGKTVVLNFWASWCPPCRAELPELKSFFNQDTSENIVFLSINLYTTETNPENLDEFIKKEDLPFPVLLDISGKVSELYNVESIPTTVIIDSQGYIRKIKTGAVTQSWLKSKTSLP